MKKAIETSGSAAPWRQWQPGQPLLRLTAVEVRERFEVWARAALVRRARLSYAEYVEDIQEWNRFSINFPNRSALRGDILEKAGCPWRYEPAVATGFAWGDRGQGACADDLIDPNLIVLQPMVGGGSGASTNCSTKPISISLSSAGIGKNSDGNLAISQVMVSPEAAVTDTKEASARSGNLVKTDLLEVDDYVNFGPGVKKRRAVLACDRAEDAMLSLGWFRGIDFSGETGELFIELARELKDEITWQEYLCSAGYAEKYFKREGLAKGRISSEQYVLIMKDVRQNLIHGLYNSIYGRKSRPQRQNLVLSKSGQAEFVKDFDHFMTDQNLFKGFKSAGSIIKARVKAKKQQGLGLFASSDVKAIPLLNFIDLSYSDLSTLNLVGADINFSILQFCNLQSADLSGADFAGCDIRGATVAQNITKAYGLEYSLTSGEQIPFLLTVDLLYELYIRGSENSWIKYMSFVPESTASMRQNSRMALKLLQNKDKINKATNSYPYYGSYSQPEVQSISTHFYWKPDFSFLEKMSANVFS